MSPYMYIMQKLFIDADKRDPHVDEYVLVTHKHRAALAEETFGTSASYLLDIADKFFELIKHAGYIFLAWALFQFILALKDETTEPKIRATGMLIGAVVMINLSSIVDLIFAETAIGGAF